ncbi:Uncharacterized protein DAT39_001703 [Clarias magur]|uniref:Uncharacterized protein n=1 Tax=Clarias magur TaxID=1594786 RepID=A0A8J4UQA6_CLAMG|nr:Uncharacterized protein DAT39_001703 [Clarias magur]
MDSRSYIAFYEERSLCKGLFLTAWGETVQFGARRGGGTSQPTRPIRASEKKEGRNTPLSSNQSFLPIHQSDVLKIPGFSRKHQFYLQFIRLLVLYNSPLLSDFSLP